MPGKDELLEALLRRLRQITVDDYSEVRDRCAFEEASRLAKLLRCEPDGGDPQTWEMVGLFYWNRFIHVRDDQDRAYYDAAVSAFARCFATGLEVPKRLHDAVVDEVANELVDQLEYATRVADAAAISPAIQLLERVIAATAADDPERPIRISNLSGALCARYEWTGDLADLEMAITSSHQAIEVLPSDDPGRAAPLSNLGIALLRRFERLGALADLDAAIDADRAAAEAAAPDDPGRTGMLVNLSGALTARFDALNDVTDLNAAMAAGREAADAMPRLDPRRALLMSNLAIAQRAQFEYAGELSAIDESIATARRALAGVPAAGPERAATLANLSGSLVRRFERAADVADLDEAITLAKDAIEALSGQHADRAGYLSGLSTALMKRFERTGDLGDINATIAAGREAVQAATPGSRLWAVATSGLCHALWGRFRQIGDSADLEAAISAGREVAFALSREPATAHLLGVLDQAIFLSTLSIALTARFELARNPADLDEAIAAARQAAELTRRSDVFRAMPLTQMCSALRLRFEISGDPADLDDAIAAGRQAVKAIPGDHQYLPVCLSNLCGALQTRYERTGKRSNLKEAIALGQRAASTATADHPLRATILSNLGRALYGRSQQGRSRKLAAECVAAYAAATRLASAPPTLRVLAARSAVRLAAKSDPVQAADLLDAAVRLLPQTVPRQLGRPDQEHALSGFAGLASDAAALTLTAGGTGSAERALGLLELGRAVLYGQALDLDSDLSALASQHPHLAARFRKLRAQLDSADLLSARHWGGSDGTPTARQRESRDRHGIVAEYSALLGQVRTLAGFETFLLPPPPEELISQAQLGPVIVLNVSEYRSDALAVTSSGIVHIPLPALATDTLIERIGRFDHALHTITDPLAALAELRLAQDVLSEVLEWLWDVAAAPVLSCAEIAQALKAPPGDWPRLWWAPGGLLGRLPLHAAGFHRRGGGDTVLDRVISSYTPTIRALAHARQHDRVSPPARSLIVAMPTTPGQSALPEAAREALLLQALLPDPVVLLKQDPHTPDERTPTKANVLRQLASAEIVHFACHAASDPADPSSSQLYLEDYEQDPLTIASLAAVHLDQGQLAYLSACQSSLSASGDLLDEAIHLTSAFQLAGYPHVIGTLWEIGDQIAADIAETVYAHMRTDAHFIATGQAARALHRTIRDYRDRRPAAPFRWAAHVHVGV